MAQSWRCQGDGGSRKDEMFFPYIPDGIPDDSRRPYEATEQTTVTDCEHFRKNDTNKTGEMQQMEQRCSNGAIGQTKHPCRGQLKQPCTVCKNCTAGEQSRAEDSLAVPLDSNSLGSDQLDSRLGFVVEGFSGVVGGS